MNRRKARENAFIALFEVSFGGSIEEVVSAGREVDDAYAVDEFGLTLLNGFAQHSQEVDTLIESKLKGWKVNRLARVSLAVLRLAVTEMLYGQPGMDSVVINEAVELSKKYGEQEDYQFVNGVLGSLARARGQNNADSIGPNAAAGEE